MATITGFLPFGYGTIIAGQEGGRINVSALSSKKVEEVFNKATGFQQEGIIHDLAVENETCASAEQKDKMGLAAKLLVKMPKSYDRQDFFMHLIQAHLNGYKSVQANFARAMETNYTVDLASNSGLTEMELAREGHYATFLADKYIK